jgi:hypothetical protein
VTGLPMFFSARKYKYGAITWLLCLVLLIPSYLDTGILSIAALIPCIGLLGLYFWLEGKRAGITLNAEGIEITSRRQFLFRQTKFNLDDIEKVIVDIIKEEKEEIINTIKLVTASETIDLPDVDDKGGFLNHLIGVNKKLTIEKVYELTEKQKKQVNNLMLFSVFIAVLGIVYSLVFSQESVDTAIFLRILKGGFIGYIIGIILWFFLFNLKGYYDKG